MRRGLPCTRGDSPGFFNALTAPTASALHTRGFTQPGLFVAALTAVCPAHAGIHPLSTSPASCPGCLPCTRGDSPSIRYFIPVRFLSALHTRGFTVRIRAKNGRGLVCPAHVGIHPPERTAAQPQMCLPCTRGDSPTLRDTWDWRTRSALHTRGFTACLKRQAQASGVCPAHAGIHLRHMVAVSVLCRLPCTRGDSPWQRHLSGAPRTSALHTRGFTIAGPSLRSS